MILAPTLHSLADYLQGENVLILDASPVSCNVLSRFVEKLGCAPDQIYLVNSFDQARNELAKGKTRLVFTEFAIGPQFSFELLLEYKRLMPTKSSDLIFIVLSDDAAQYKVSMAVEHDVDSYIIKPYAFDTVQQTIQHVLNQRLSATAYRTLIKEGKELLVKGEIPSANHRFSLAMVEDEVPTLACYYSAQAEFMQSNYEASEQRYGEVLALTPFHLEGLTGLFKLHLQQKKHQEAYDTLKSLIEYFPANEDRLQNVLELTIITENFHDIDIFLKIYLALNEPSAKLTKHYSSALCISAKFYLKQKMKVRALELFQTAIEIALDPSPTVLYSVDALSQNKLKNESMLIMGKSDSLLDNVSREISKYYIDSMDADFKKVARLLDDGLRICASGNGTPGVYERLVVQLFRAGLVDDAETIATEAKLKWPLIKDRFNLPKLV